MMRRLLLILIFVLPVAASGEEPALKSAVRQMLLATSARSPIAIAVADRQVHGNPELLLSHIELSNRSLLLSLRCRVRKQCGDVIATAQYDSRDAAVEALERLVQLNQPKENVVPAIHAGERVRLVVYTHTSRLELPVSALNSGAISHTIRVRDPRTRRIYTVVVVGPKEVRMSL